jgi:Ca2+-transporting ATPase
VETDLTFIGYFSMIDPARPEVKDAVETSRRAGIRTMMITGDHQDTAMAIARELDIWQEGDHALSGEQLQKMDEKELQQAVTNTAVFARVSPEDKLRIVKALKSHNHVVAMTGDGVNDAPALKRADIGVSMGITGTEVAKEASEMVLMDDNYATIVGAVNEGRTIYSNIRKSVHYLLSCNIGEIVTIFTAILLGLGSPLTAIQIQWTKLCTTATSRTRFLVKNWHGQAPGTGLCTVKHRCNRSIKVLFATVAGRLGSFVLLLQHSIHPPFHQILLSEHCKPHPLQQLWLQQMLPLSRS